MLCNLSSKIKVICMDFEDTFEYTFGDRTTNSCNAKKVANPLFCVFEWTLQRKGSDFL